MRSERPSPRSPGGGRRFLSLGDVSLSVNELPHRARRRRAGPPIVMIHGLAASSAFWHAAGAPFLTLLGPCLAYDLRGHGRSSRPLHGYTVADMTGDLEALLDAQGIDRAHLVAHSFGGSIALAYALRHPERVASLVLADVRVRPLQPVVDVAPKEVPPGVARRLAACGIDPAALPRADDGVDYLRAVARIQMAAGEDAGALLNRLYGHGRLFRTAKAARAWIELSDRGSLLEDLKADSPFSAEDLSRIEQPMLILVGSRSTTRPSAEGLAQLCPQAILRVVPRVGHFFPITQPRLFLRPSIRFLRAVSSSRLQTGSAKPGPG
ncbi:MAG: alpha/beta hydrolase [Pseudomonadota bacterium]